MFQDYKQNFYKLRNQLVALVFFFVAGVAQAQTQGIPKGFTPLFNGKNVAGWHMSRTSHQGTTPHFFVRQGVLFGTQHPFGQGGILLTNKKYKNFELYVEVKLDSFCNSGIFLRSTESGQAYQIELAEPGGTGDLLGERLAVSKPATATERASVWKPNDWNVFRIRMEGAVPKLTLWINGKQMWTVTEPQNDFIAGATEGFIGLQVHWSAPYAPNVAEFDMSGSWRPGSVQRFRNIAIKELK
jgi:hypothetical protein